MVPRAEPTKPGRFARAIAAAEESGRGSGKQAANDQNGWKSRIAFPQEKTESIEKVPDESPVSNSMNRAAGEKAAEKAANDEEKRP